MVRCVRHTMQILTLLLAVACSLPLYATNAPETVQTPLAAHTLEATHDDVPTWESLGLEDVLTPPTECSMSAPQCTPAHHSGSAHHSCASSAAQQPLPATRQLNPQPPRPSRSNDYYLYFLYRLRL